MQNAGRIEVEDLGDGVVECRAIGHVRLDDVLAAQREMDRMQESRTDVRAVLFDGSRNDSYEPGLPIRWVRWAASRSYSLSRVAVVARPGPMSAIAATLPYLLPGRRIGIFVSRSDAMDYLRARPKRVSDRHPRI